MGNETIYLLFIANSLSSTLSYRIAARWTREIGSLKVLRFSLIVRIALFPVLILPFHYIGNTGKQILITAVIIGLIGMTWAFVNVSTLVIVSKFAPANIKGQVFGVYNSIIGVSAVAGSLIGGYTAKFGSYLITFLIAGLLVAIGLSLATNRLKMQKLNRISS